MSVSCLYINGKYWKHPGCALPLHALLLIYPKDEPWRGEHNWPKMTQKDKKLISSTTFALLGTLKYMRAVRNAHEQEFGSVFSSLEIQTNI